MKRSDTEPTFLNRPSQALSDGHRKLLLNVAADSIKNGLNHRGSLRVDPSTLPKELQAPRATFVTLERRGRLRGCIGSLQASLPLVQDVAENAFSAAFRDPRFDPLTPEEFKDLDIHISVLGIPEKMSFTSEQDFLNQLRPGIDGIILQDGYHRGTFLPSVWEDLPNPADFLSHLKLKAGLPMNYWSDTLQAWRYTTEYFP